jgi:acyl-CoA thioesterase-2
MSAIRTAGEGFTVHSMHSYFLLPGDPMHPIVYDVQRIRDGRSFQTRRVAARQHGREIFYLTANLQLHEEGYEHQDTMPAALPAEEGIDLRALMTKGGTAEGEALAREWAAVDARIVGNSLYGLEKDPSRPAQQRIWLKIAERLPDDPNIHLAAFTWASDISLLGASLAAHTLDSSRVQMASLDHTIWFHRPFRADEWFLYDQQSPSASGARGLAEGKIYSRDGRLVCSVVQEGLVRNAR